MAAYIKTTMSGEMKGNLRKLQDKLVFLESAWNLRHFQCLHCSRIAIFHAITNCAHLLCQECFEDFENQKCPICKKVTIVSKTKDFLLEEHIFNLEVECLNRKHGCKDILLLKEFLDHYQKCSPTPFRKSVNVPEQEEEKWRKAEDMPGPDKWQKFSGEDYYSSLDSYNSFTKLKDSVDSFDSYTELKDSVEEIQTLLAEMKEAMKDLRKHRKEEARFRMSMLKKIKAMQKNLAEFKFFNPDNRKEETTFVWKVSVKEDLKLARTGSRQTVIHGSGPIALKKTEFKMKAQVLVKHEEVCVYLVKLNGSPSEMRPIELKVILVDQTKNDSKQDFIKMCGQINEDTLPYYLKFRLNEPVEESRFFKNGCIVLHVVLEIKPPNEDVIYI